MLRSRRTEQSGAKLRRVIQGDWASGPQPSLQRVPLFRVEKKTVDARALLERVSGSGAGVLIEQRVDVCDHRAGVRRRPGAASAAATVRLVVWPPLKRTWTAM